LPADKFFRLDGRIAVVTSGGQGIGEGIARRFALRGGAIGCPGPQPGGREHVSETIYGLAVPCDALRQRLCARRSAPCNANCERSPSIVNNAKITGRAACLCELDENELDQVYGINLRGVYLMCQAVISGMLKKRCGRIVNVASIAGKEGKSPTIAVFEQPRQRSFA
jgi:2-dehydro-3-deoxy-L-rhamnonate dehydrogenase (NAD+)